MSRPASASGSWFLIIVTLGDGDSEPDLESVPLSSSGCTGIWSGNLNGGRSASLPKLGPLISLSEKLPIIGGTEGSCFVRLSCCSCVRFNTEVGRATNHVLSQLPREPSL